MTTTPEERRAAAYTDKERGNAWAVLYERFAGLPVPPYRVYEIEVDRQRLEANLTLAEGFLKRFVSIWQSESSLSMLEIILALGALYTEIAAFLEEA